MFLLDRCIALPPHENSKAWFTPMLFDPAYLNAACFTVQTYYDGLYGRTRSAESQQRDRLYYAKAVRALQERLADEDESLRLSDSTIMTVLALSGHAYTSGDEKSVKDHSKGLLRLASMRGMSTFFDNTKLCIEIIR